MHLSTRLGYDSGRPITRSENEALAAFERWFIEEDFLFLRQGASIAVASDFGTTLVVVRSADAREAKLAFVLAPDAAVPEDLVRRQVAKASARRAAGLRLWLVEGSDRPLTVRTEVILARPYHRDDVRAAFAAFAHVTDIPIGDAMRAASGDDAEGDPCGFSDRVRGMAC